MKRFIYTALILLAVFLTSCGSAQITLRDAKSATLGNPVLVQLPTVVELQVDSIAMVADTTWSEQTVTQEQMVTLLTASLLDRCAADVLIEPRVTYKATISGFSSKFEMTVKGFPARYKNFHTATKEDLQLIEGCEYVTSGKPTVINVINGQKVAAEKDNTAGTPAQPKKEKTSKLKEILKKMGLAK